MSLPPADPLDTVATLASWRAQQAHRADPVRFLFMEALARRTATQNGAVRQLLEQRLAELMEGYRQALASHASGPQATAPAAAARGALGQLVDAVAGTAGLEPLVPAVRTDAAVMRPAGPPRELKALQRFRGTWSRLSAEQRLRQAFAQVPPQAGPLNSHHLVHRALVLMRDTSPEYLQRFVAHVDALLWLDQMQSAAIAMPARAQGRRRVAGDGGQPRRR